MKKKLVVNNQEVEFHLIKNLDGEMIIEVDNQKFELSTLKSDPDHFIFKYNDKNHFSNISPSKKNGLIVDGVTYTVGPIDRSKSSSTGSDSEAMSSPMPGKILKLLVDLGATVSKGDGLLIMEAMKMEHTIKASHDGILEKFYFAEGELVDGGVELVGLKGMEEA
ncbi:MAG: acetyl-CoA carboxylase biotin carboxyl carrier protein subunit [Bacteriovoracaceae bacterium]|nr:acetyl-CoA carboxylase biotin carboxyl carrier protein subunit [Bacteriovoracaceae bacterium]